MSAPTDFSGLFREAYADGLVDLVPEFSVISRKVPFAKKQAQNGNLYHQPVVVRLENGVTYSAPNAGAVALNSALSMKTQDAQVAGYNVTIVGLMDYETAARAKGGRNAFEDATRLQVKTMMKSGSKRIELGILYGQTGLAVTASSVNINATSTTVTFTTASWSDGIWSGLEGAQVAFWTSGGSLISSGVDAIFTIGVVSTSARTIVITGTATGITALDAATAAGASVFFYGARTGSTAYNEMAGLDKILTNTGTLFNIDAATYGLWKANSYAAGGALTFGKLQSAVAVAVGRGLDTNVDIMVNPKTWGNLLNDQAANRKLDDTYSPAKVDNGSKSIVFYSQNGTMSIVAHPFVKEGEAFVVPMQSLQRLGATDLTFNRLGDENNGQIFLESAGLMGFEYRCYSNQAILLETPAQAVKVTGIVNT